MSGHSKWSTIKRKKGANDAARGQLFSKLSKAVSIAVKTGGSDNPAMNNSLKVAIEAARVANMPKETIERAIKKASETGDLTEVTYEGFGPEGCQIMIHAATDNKNRTAQEIKQMLTRAGGNMGGPGTVSFNFKPKGYILVKKLEDIDSQTLTLIDLGVEDVEESSEGLDIYVNPASFFEMKEILIEKGFDILDSELIQKPLTHVKVDSSFGVKKIVGLLESLEEHEDVQSVYTNADFDESKLNE